MKMRPFIALPNYCGDGASNHSGVIVSRTSAEARAINSEIRRHKLTSFGQSVSRGPTDAYIITSLGIGEVGDSEITKVVT